MSVGPARPDETRAQFVARVVAAAPPPTSELMATLRPLFPPVPAAEAANLGRAS